MPIQYLRIALWLCIALALGAIGTWVVGKIRDHARAPLLEQIQQLQVAAATADELARARLQAAQAAQDARARENAAAQAAEIQRLADLQAARDRDHRALVDRMRAALAARTDRLPNCRSAVPEASRGAASGAAAAAAARGSRTGNDADSAERAAALVERIDAVNAAYQSLLAAAKAGRCILLKD